MNDWTKFVREQKDQDLKALIEDENLNIKQESLLIIHLEMDKLKLQEQTLKILPPMRRFGGGNRNERKQTIIEKVLKFFEKYFGLSV